MRLSNLTTTLLALDSLSIYRGLLKDKVLSRLKALLIYLDEGDVALRKVINLYNGRFCIMAVLRGLQDNLLTGLRDIMQ